MKRLPADTTPSDIRLAAKFVFEATKCGIFEQIKTARLLLDRALALSPEDDETKALRETLK